MKHVTEVVIYQIKKDQISKFSDLSNRAETFLQEQQGLLERQVLRDLNDPSIFSDIIKWESVGHFESAMKATEQNADLKPFFEATEKTISFSIYNSL